MATAIRYGGDWDGPSVGQYSDGTWGATQWSHRRQMIWHVFHERGSGVGFATREEAQERLTEFLRLERERLRRQREGVCSDCGQTVLRCLDGTLRAHRTRDKTQRCRGSRRATSRQSPRHGAPPAPTAASATGGEPDRLTDADPVRTDAAKET